MKPKLQVARLLPVLVLLCWSAAAQGQQSETLPEPDEVLNAFYDALGGEMALAGLSEIMVRGNYRGASSGTIEAMYKDGKFLLDYKTDGIGTIRKGFDGTTWWQSFPGQPAAELEGKDRALSRHYTLLPPQFLNKALINANWRVAILTLIPNPLLNRATDHRRGSDDDTTNEFHSGPGALSELLESSRLGTGASVAPLG